VRQTTHVTSDASQNPGFRVLVVCTGNICRSPAGERLLRHRLPLGSGIEVASAGTHGVVGHPVEPTMARLLVEDGVDAEHFAARRLSAALVAEADLVLGMETEHRSAAVTAYPRALTRTFTLREFAHLVEVGRLGERTARLSADPAARLREIAALAAELRIARSVPVCAEPDIADPYGQGEAAYRVAYAAITQSAEILSLAAFT